MYLRTKTAIITLLLLCIGAGAALIDCARLHRERTALSREFQGLLLGFGTGPAVDFAECTGTFDKRWDDTCTADLGPIPGGACFCPRHGGGIVNQAPSWPTRTQRGN